MYTRLENFGAGGLNADIFETGLSGAEWSVLENVDIDTGAIVNAGGEVQRNFEANVEPYYLYLFDGGISSFDVVSDGFSLYANNGQDGWLKIGEDLGGGRVTYDTYESCLIVNSETSGAWFWCPASGFYDTWALGGDDDWTTGPDIEWTGEVLVTDTWLFGADTTWTTGDDISWDWFPDDTGSVVAGGIAQLPDWGADWRAQRVVAYGSQLVALGVSESAGDEGDALYKLRWSSLGASGLIPQEWVPDVGNFAGFVRVGDTPGGLAAAAQLRDDLILYKTDSIWRLTATGDPSFPMRLEKVATGAGVESPLGVADEGTAHFFMSRRGFGMFDGNGIRFLDFNRVQDDLLRELAGREVSDIVAEYYGRKQEIWIGYRATIERNVTQPPEDLDLILKFNLQHNAFTRHRYTGKGLKTFSAGRERAADLEDDTWQGGDFASWSEGIDSSWESRALPQSAEAMILGYTGRIVAGYRPELSPKYPDGESKNCLAVRYGLRLADERQVMLKAVYPECEGALLTVEPGVSWAPGQQAAGTTTWEPERNVVPGVTRKIPLRVRGDTFALRVTSNTDFKLHALGIEYEPVARR